MLRLGFSETTLLYYYYLENILKIHIINYKHSPSSIINWLYTTSGFYDKSITGEYMKFNADQCIKSKVYNEYFKRLLNIIKNYNGNIFLCIGIVVSDTFVNMYINDFKQYLNKDKLDNYLSIQDLYKKIENKNVLIINNLGILMKQQYDSGNLKKCYDFCPNIKSIEYFNPGYTFFNDGPDESILDTVDKLCQQKFHQWQNVG